MDKHLESETKMADTPHVEETTKAKTSTNPSLSFAKELQPVVNSQTGGMKIDIHKLHKIKSHPQIHQTLSRKIDGFVILGNYTVGRRKHL